ncbi:MAG: hypothetical protein OEQ47_09215 [Acidimicrobiia bacterium]|nr:hypothetical protein [Acidimicrobiia bacterium]
MELLSTSQIGQLTGDQLDSLLEQIRVADSQLKAVQLRVLREVDRRQIPLGDGMRTLEDWIVGRLDVTQTTARKRVTVARTDSADLDHLLTDGVSFDRVAELASAGETDPHLELDLPALRSVLARRAEITASDEHASFDDRFVAIQPTLDESAWSLWGKLPALEGKHIAETLDQIADELPTPPHGHRESRATRRADALLVVCDRHGTDESKSTGSPISPPATVFVDATNASTRPTAWIASGPRIGPSTLERILCGSPIDVIALTKDGQPLKVGNATTAIPLGDPQVRGVAGRRHVHRRRVQLHLPTPTPPHHRSLRWWRPPPHQPHQPVLVPPPCRDPRPRLPDRVDQPHQTKTLPPTRSNEQRPAPLMIATTPRAQLPRWRSGAPYLRTAPGPTSSGMLEVIAPELGAVRRDLPPLRGDMAQPASCSMTSSSASKLA